jgi:glutaminyl-tRNA synthetase
VAQTARHFPYGGKNMAEPSNFIEQIVESDLAEQKIGSVKTRFPPEPNGYLHIGHAKSMFVNFGTAQKFGGTCNLFFDDTNPSKEKTEFVDAIRKDILWLGYQWEKEVYASDFFDIIYEYALKLIREGKAYVCDLSPEEIKNTRGTLTEAGTESPYRNRPPEENERLFGEMREGKYADGEKCLRAKIDMASPNMNLRDPVIYRILRATHHRTGDKWCVYPMYDYAHPICDYLQGVTHSLCTLEFEDHRPLYDWVGYSLGFVQKPRQIEFARLNLTNLVMSKRYLKKLVEEHSVHGWDDPRMPTLAGLRNRGIPAEAIRDFCARIGVAKANSECEISYFEAVVREYLNAHAPRAMAVVEPLKLTLTNYEGSEEIDFEINQLDPTAGTRKVRFGKTLYIERSDFSLDPPPKYHRLKIGACARLKNAYIVRCDEAVTDADGNVTEIKCTYFPESRSGADTSGIKAKGVLHWVNAETCVDAALVQYDHLLRDAEFSGQDFSERINLDSEHVFAAKAEPYLKEACEGTAFQLMRTGYYKTCTRNDKLCLSEIVSLKDNFNK